jgi:hypothetical protein
MVAGIREDMAAGNLLGQREQGRVVCHVARGEHQASLHVTTTMQKMSDSWRPNIVTLV